jgi:hypothetical protein
MYESRGFNECNHGRGESYLLFSVVYNPTENSLTTAIFKNLTRAIWVSCEQNAKLTFLYKHPRSFMQEEKNDLIM